jgi:hypothetical protein
MDGSYVPIRVCPKVRRQSVAILLPLGNRRSLLRHLTLYSGGPTNGRVTANCLAGVASRRSLTAGFVRICGKHGRSDTVQVTRPVRQLGHDSHRNLHHRPRPSAQEPLVPPPRERRPDRALLLHGDLPNHGAGRRAVLTGAWGACQVIWQNIFRGLTTLSEIFLFMLVATWSANYVSLAAVLSST